MNYIKRLERDNTDLKAQLADAMMELKGLEIYLQSPKFHNDPTVQVQDVFNRIAGLKSALI